MFDFHSGISFDHSILWFPRPTRKLTSRSADQRLVIQSWQRAAHVASEKLQHEQLESVFTRLGKVQFGESEAPFDNLLQVGPSRKP